MPARCRTSARSRAGSGRTSTTPGSGSIRRRISSASRAHCSRHAAGDACPYANICETCDNYTPAAEFIPALTDQLTDVHALRTDAEQRGCSYWGLLHGHVLNELQEVVVDPEETDALLRLGLHRLPNKEFPRLRGLAKALLDGYDGAAALDESLDLLLNGLKPPEPAPRKAARRKG